MLRTSSIALLAFIATAAAGPRLALRHDIDEAEYVKLGESFPAVVQVAGLASGTLVAPNWVLTVAHAPEMLQRMAPDRPLTVSVGGKDYEVATIVVPEEREKEKDRHDIALLELAESVPESLAPLPIWLEEAEAGEEFVIAGWGILALGDEGVEVSPQAMASPTRRLRAGWNALVGHDPERHEYVALFDGPDDAVELEAGPSIGDSGGPALLRQKGEGEAPDTWHVLGVVAALDDGDGDRILCEYGEEFVLTDVAAYADWIQDTIAE